MTAIRFEAIETTEAAALWDGGPDAYGMVPERRRSDGTGVPCRHCLKPVDAGEDYLVLAFRPFPELQPYAETGPIFLHAEPCPRHEGSASLPDILVHPDYIVRGYDADNRIVYGTGAVTPTADIASRAAGLLADDNIAFVHVRSARNNCYQCRIVRD